MLRKIKPKVSASERPYFVLIPQIVRDESCTKYWVWLEWVTEYRWGWISGREAWRLVISPADMARIQARKAQRQANRDAYRRRRSAWPFGSFPFDY